MFELTGTLTYVIPVILSVLVAKTVADALEPKGIYDLVIECVFLLDSIFGKLLTVAICLTLARCFAHLVLLPTLLLSSPRSHTMTLGACNCNPFCLGFCPTGYLSYPI